MSYEWKMQLEDRSWQRSISLVCIFASLNFSKKLSTTWKYHGWSWRNKNWRYFPFKSYHSSKRFSGALSWLLFQHISLKALLLRWMIKEIHLYLLRIYRESVATNYLVSNLLFYCIQPIFKFEIILIFTGV